MSQIYAQIDPTVRFETSYQAQKGAGATPAAAAALALVHGVGAVAALGLARGGMAAPFDFEAAMTALSLLAFFLARRTSAVWTAGLVLGLAILTALLCLPGVARHLPALIMPVFALLTAIRGFRASLALERLARSQVG